MTRRRSKWYVDLFRGGDYYRGWAAVIGPELTAQQVEFVVEALDLPNLALSDRVLLMLHICDIYFHSVQLRRIMVSVCA